MKKLLKFIISIVVLFSFFTATFALKAEENGEIPVEPVGGEIIEPTEGENVENEPILASKVVLKESEYGDLTFDITEGNVGDVVTITVKPYVFCKLTSLTANGVELIPNEDGEYKFALVDGENVVVPTFEIDSEQMEVIADLMAKAQKGDWDQIFTMENLMNLVCWAITAFLSSGFMVTLLKNKKIKAETTEQIKQATMDIIQASMNGTMNEYLENVFSQSMDKISGRLEKTEDLCLTMTKCFALSQENTPESRIAIITELAKLDTKTADVSAEVKAIIDEEVKKLQQIQETKVKAIEELEKANDSIEVKIEKEEVKAEEIEGRV